MRIRGDLTTKISELAKNHPAEAVRRGFQEAEGRRIAFHVGLVAQRMGTSAAIADLGGGIGLFSLACAAVGMKVSLVDDFRDPVNEEAGAAVLDYHRAHGITVCSRDVVASGIGVPPRSLDAVTSFDSMEHWHASPKRLFAEVRRALVPGGLFVLGVPNCVNLRKRITVPLGWGKWSSMADWYEREVFRGHVREADVSDLLYIARDIRCEVFVYMVGTGSDT
jgi:SAM-dependent methyltransferase